jgi:uncharacterized protein
MHDITTDMKEKILFLFQHAMDPTLIIILLIITGIVSGLLNTLASGGSVITMPVLIFLGVPSTVANGTNRIPILAGSLTAVISFWHKGILALDESIRLAIPTMAGAAIGALIASYLKVETMTAVVVGVTIISLGILLFNPRKLILNPPEKAIEVTNRGMLLFFLVGIWAGFIIIDTATFLLLGLILVVGFEIIRANAVKNFLLLGISGISLGIFIIRGEVNLVYGIIICIGSIVGSYIGSILATKEEIKVWIFYLLIAAVLLEMVHFLQMYL